MPGVKQRGFTLTEILVVVALLAVLFTIGVILSMQGFHNYSRRLERDTIVSLLQRARSRAMANTGQHAWGVCYDGSTYHLFFGSYPSSQMDTISANSAVTLDVSEGAAFLCSNGGVMFDQLTGDTNDASIKVSEASVVSTISINREGMIDW